MAVVEEDVDENYKLKVKQYEALKSIVVDQRDTLVVLSTGYGKSVIYQILPTVLNSYGHDCKNHCSVDVG